MIKDGEVKTVVSPFAVRENEIKVFDGKEGFASINQVVFKMDMGYIGELHVEALKVVNEFSFVTSRQVTQVMDLRGKLNEIEKEKRQDKVSKLLEDLTKSKVLARYYFESASGKSSFRVYGIDKLGTYILKQRNIPTYWQPTDNIKAAYELKRKLAGNQVAIAYMEKVASYDEVNNVVLYSKKYNVKFKPTGSVITLDDGLQKKNLVFEVVRRNDDWQNMFATKVQLYSDFFENFAVNDAGFSEPPTLIFVGEDKKHLADMFKVVKQITGYFSDDEILFTMDLEQLGEDLTNSIVAFKQDEVTKKYKLVTVEMPLLKPGENKNSNDSDLKPESRFNANMVIE